MLTDAKCRTTTVEDGKEKKISDGFGLYLLVKPNGSKLWHMAYRFNGRQKKLSFGVYGPDGQGKVSLAAARQKRDAAKTLIAQGIDPGVAKKEEKQEKAAARLFSSWADEWLGAEEKVCSERTMKGKRRFVRYLKNQFGSSTIRDITVEKVVAYLKTVQDEGKLETRDRSVRPAKIFANSPTSNELATTRFAISATFLCRIFPSRDRRLSSRSRLWRSFSRTSPRH
jgi:Arm DNA-binding domain